ncbi:unnamed protein product [Arabidopsis thaliana]|uniref:protein-serine/threonine phosphatase n=1 Tax=Arabidopsis thaliana TaxID=3702 RepID=A0A7G2F6K7_ARATH|nr:unnamed protein product [Arabidopsis thaliana]
MGYLDLALSYSNQPQTVEAPASGGGLSQNGKFSYGYASSAGKRSSMEDFFETRIDGINGEIVGLFGVFDGHGGARAAEYVKRHLFSNLITHPKFISDTKSAITDAYNHTDSELLKSENSHNRDAGSTASTAILVGDRLVVANVGDSRAVISRGGKAIAVSRDHKPDQSDERERIENAGGFVMWAGTWRVGGVLAVSRAFGDRLLKQYVVADPEIQEEKIDDTLEFLILASDGLWDVFSNEAAVAMVKEVEDPEDSAKKLVGEAIKRGSADNITCVVVRFLEKKSASSSHISSSSSKEAKEMPPLGDLAISSNEAKQVQIGSGNKPENVTNRKPDTASRSTDTLTLERNAVTDKCWKKCKWHSRKLNDKSHARLSWLPMGSDTRVRVYVALCSHLYVELLFLFFSDSKMRTIVSRLIRYQSSLSQIRFVSASGGGRYLSTDSNKIDEPFNVEEAETVHVPPPPTEKLLVLGGNGFVGSHVCKEALDRGLSVSSLSRSGRSSLQESWASRVTWHQGNLLSSDLLKDALEGVTSVISCVGGFGSNSYMYKINGTANINAIRAASEKGVKRFVYISAADFGLANYLLRGYYEGKLLTRFAYGGIILRPGFIYGTRSVGSMKIPLGVFGSPMEMVLQQAKPLNQLPLVGPLFTPPVNVESVAKVAVRAATDPVFPPGIVDVHGIQRYSQQKSR